MIWTAGQFISFFQKIYEKTKSVQILTCGFSYSRDTFYLYAADSLPALLSFEPLIDKVDQKINLAHTHLTHICYK